MPLKVDTVGSLNTLQARQRPSVPPPAARSKALARQPLSKQAFRPLIPPRQTAFPTTI